MIISNQLKCISCGDEIFSSHRHDYVECSCGKCMVDGGQSYIRRSISGFEQDMSMNMDKEVVDALKGAITWAKENGRNDLGLVFAFMRTLRDYSNLNVTDVKIKGAV